MKKKYFRVPPEGATTFFDLFQYIWDNGIGNELLPNAMGRTWTPESLQQAFEDNGYHISIRAIEMWKSRSSLPSLRNARALAHTVSKVSNRDLWQACLLMELRKEQKRRKESVDDSQSQNTDKGSNHIEASSNPKFQLPLLAVGIGTAILLIAGLMATVFSTEIEPRPKHPPFPRVGSSFQDTFFNFDAKGPEMTVLPTGSFVMGAHSTEPYHDSDEEPRHTVEIDYRIAVSNTEITNADWMICVNNGGCSGYIPAGLIEADPLSPVVNISWNDIYAYTRWLNRELKINQKRTDRYTLLTESEWEYAALSGSQSAPVWPYSTGLTLKTIDAQFETDRTKKVASFAPSEWGLYDMHGNVSEWVEDCYRDTYAVKPRDGHAFLQHPCPYRVIRGGAFNETSKEQRVTERKFAKPETRLPSTGFRIARRFGWRKPAVKKLKVCAHSNFDFDDFICTKDVSDFAPGTTTIYVSLHFQDVPEGEKFSRRWYRNGRKILEKESANIDPWNGWTWFGNENPASPNAVPLTPGKYTLQIQVRDIIAVKNFTILEQGG